MHAQRYFMRGYAKGDRLSVGVEIGDHYQYGLPQGSFQFSIGINERGKRMADMLLDSPLADVYQLGYVGIVVKEYLLDLQMLLGLGYRYIGHPLSLS
jgi:hypothetical protein